MYLFKCMLIAMPSGDNVSFMLMKLMINLSLIELKHEKLNKYIFGNMNFNIHIHSIIVCSELKRPHTYKHTCKCS